MVDPALVTAVQEAAKGAPNTNAALARLMSMANSTSGPVYATGAVFRLPLDPTGLPPEWTHDPGHRDPNGSRWRHPSGEYLDFHNGRPGQPGWRGRDHWHHNGGDDHLTPGQDEIPDPEPVSRPERQPERTPVEGGEPVVVPVPAPEPTGEPAVDPDEPSLRERISEITGLTGIALTIYLIVSEGSRIVFPPRNIIPVP
ncbi:hypothetical protein [Jidongwangia harbinensis]|uniref:hypothetical protein n=1 Tax=Jidongwangia harbinensis TaxID=2878561 RepID=UPI001CD91E4D|nr:hypothetical protein [Jidongwangia harbinensis]MCA2215466.1 hypothetical protein [Jidongwangia harbinensis]